MAIYRLARPLYGGTSRRYENKRAKGKEALAKLGRHVLDARKRGNIKGKLGLSKTILRSRARSRRSGRSGPESSGRVVRCETSFQAYNFLPTWRPVKRTTAMTVSTTMRCCKIESSRPSVATALHHPLSYHEEIRIHGELRGDYKGIDRESFSMFELEPAHL